MTSTRASSRRTPPGRCGSSARPIPSRRAAGTCSRPTTTTRSTASASSPAPAAQTWSTCPSTRPTSGSPTPRWTHDCAWDVLLDCAAFAPTSRLDLSSVEPDFVAVSFYKMFGYPTGIGALIARREALLRLRRPWFSGGTVVAATVQGEVAVRHDGHAAFEDGTVDYLGIPAVEIGLSHLERVGMRTISGHMEDLGRWLLDELQALRHSDGSPATRIYGPRTWAHRGATIAFNFLHPGGRPVDERFVDRVAAAHGVSVRTGCFCNPGAGEAAFGISADRLAAAGLGDGATMDDYLLQVGLPTGGAIRASLGLASDEADVHRFLAFAAEFCDLTGVPDDLPPREAC